LKRLFLPFLLTLAAICSGCVTAPAIPEGYSGPIATVNDSTMSETYNRAQFYYLGEIDGRRIDNVLFKTRQQNSGKGFSLATSQYSRQVPAGLRQLKLQAKIGYGAPIQEILNSSTVYEVEKTISVTLESNKTYVVKGKLSAEEKSVWLEESDTGKRIEP
jgi:hypothetical protein